ncbi:MAG: hypothetical protein HYY24_24910 [Verrucomicrobia bacterium]|nr:hypothetical protein [Verrucomicrobiota bacterium]
MQSHEYDFKAAELARLLALPLGPVLVFAGLLHLGAFTRLWPAPRPTGNTDQTVLIHQAEASRARHDADLVFIGDSSCLMDVSVDGLEAALPGHRALNLGTLSYLDLQAYAAMLDHYVAANPNRLRAVVVLLHPEMLRGIKAVPQHLATLEAFYAGADVFDTSTVRGWLSGLLGLEILNGRLLNRILPSPLPRHYGQFYGFTADLDQYLTQHRGHAADPNQFTRQAGQGSAEYRLAPRLEAGSRVIRAAVPPGVKLLIGVTPVPESFTPPEYAARHRQMLAQWSHWMQADATLSDLPPALPDAECASITHLNETGARRYSEILARSLEHHLR